MSSALLTRAGVGCLRAPNPGPLTLTGTNSWVVGRDPCWVIDPGPDLDGHLDALADEIRVRGGAGGIAVTHSHADHAAGVDGLLARSPDAVPVAAAAPEAITAGPRRRPLRDGDAFGPLRVLALPGHARDHLGFVLDSPAGRVCFTGDAVLGEGSVFVAGDMAAYLDALQRMTALDLVLICPGHGPVITEPAPHLGAYRAHRLEREAAILAAWRRGAEDENELVSRIWGPLPERLAHAATLTLRAHLEKLRDEGRLRAAP
jgi:glyoxylase-like metal-dependent hydrolase (beta-lactamase superfamily II)